MTLGVQIEGADQFYKDVKSDIKGMIRDNPKISFSEVIDGLKDNGRFEFDGGELTGEQISALKENKDLQKVFDDMPKTGWQKAGRAAEDFMRGLVTIVTGICAFVLEVACFIAISESVPNPLLGALLALRVSPNLEGVDVIKDRRNLPHALLHEATKSMPKGVEYTGSTKEIGKKPGILSRVKSVFTGGKSR